MHYDLASRLRNRFRAALAMEWLANEAKAEIWRRRLRGLSGLRRILGSRPVANFARCL